MVDVCCIFYHPVVLIYIIDIQSILNKIYFNNKRKFKQTR